MKTLSAFLSIALCCLVCAAAAASDADPASFHPAVEQLDNPCIGPFVHAYDGSIVGLAGKNAWRSTDSGRTWESYPALPEEKFSFADYCIVRVGRDIVAAFCNNSEVKEGPWGTGWGVDVSPEDYEYPVYSIRSSDNGLTWSEPVAIQRDWVGALRALAATKGGRLVLGAMAVVPWHHIINIYISDDRGEHWIHTAVVDMPDSKINDHDGALEPKLLQRKDGSLFLFIRTTKGTFYSSVSDNGGVTWSQPASTGIQNNNSFGELETLSDGSWILLWNRDPDLPAFGYKPDPSADPNSWEVEERTFSWIKPRNELSCAISSDEGKTWTEPVVLARTQQEWLAYSVFFEPQPGLFWISTQQGGLRMKVRRADIFPESEEK